MNILKVTQHVQQDSAAQQIKEKVMGCVVNGRQMIEKEAVVDCVVPGYNFSCYCRLYLHLFIK